jgi:hypothetical protein
MGRKNKLNSIILGLAIISPVFVLGQIPGLFDVLPKVDQEPYLLKPKKTKMVIALQRLYYGNSGSFTTDTLHIEVFDEHERRIEYIDFERNKHSIHYYTTYEGDQQSTTYYNARADKKPVRMVTQREFNQRHQEIEAIDGMATDSSFVIYNAHLFRYDDQNRRVYECHMCQTDDRLEYAYVFADSLLTSAYKFRGDTTQKLVLCEFSYDKNNKLSRMVCNINFANQWTFDQEKCFTYDGPRLMEATERHNFEKGAIRKYSFSYDRKGRLKERIASIDSLQMTTSYAYLKDQLVRSTTISEFPMSTEISVWFSKNAKFYGPPKTTILVTDYAYDRYGQLIRKTYSTDGVLTSEFLYEFTYIE